MADSRSWAEQPTHPGHAKSSARGGARRFPTGLSAYLTPRLPTADLVAELEAGAVEPICASAAMLLHRQGRIWIHHLGEGSPSRDVLRSIWPIRRIGSYRGAPNRIGMYAREQDGYRIMLEVESGLELARLRDLEFSGRAEWMLTQPFVIRWTLGGRHVWRAPDVLAFDAIGPFVVDVKPEAAQTELTRMMFALTERSLAQIGMRYEVLGSMSRQRMLNLRTLASQRWPNPALEGVVEAARAARRATLGGVIDSAGGGSIGAATALHLLTRELSTDLNSPISFASPVTWP